MQVTNVWNYFALLYQKQQGSPGDRAAEMPDRFAIDTWPAFAEFVNREYSGDRGSAQAVVEAGSGIREEDPVLFLEFCRRPIEDSVADALEQFVKKQGVRC